VERCVAGGLGYMTKENPIKSKAQWKFLAAKKPKQFKKWKKKYPVEFEDLPQRVNPSADETILIQKLQEMAKHYGLDFTQIEVRIISLDDYYFQQMGDGSISDLERKVSDEFFGGKVRKQINAKYDLGERGLVCPCGDNAVVHEYWNMLYDKWASKYKLGAQITSLISVPEMMAEMALYYFKEKVEYKIELSVSDGTYGYMSIGADHGAPAKLEAAICSDVFGGKVRGELDYTFDNMVGVYIYKYPRHTNKLLLDEYWTYLYNGWAKKYKSVVEKTTEEKIDEMAAHYFPGKNPYHAEWFANSGGFGYQEHTGSNIQTHSIEEAVWKDLGIFQVFDVQSRKMVGPTFETITVTMANIPVHKDSSVIKDYWNTLYDKWAEKYKGGSNVATGDKAEVGMIVELKKKNTRLIELQAITAIDPAFVVGGTVEIVSIDWKGIYVNPKQYPTKPGNFVTPSVPFIVTNEEALEVLGLINPLAPEVSTKPVEELTEEQKTALEEAKLKMSEEEKKRAEEAEKAREEIKRKKREEEERKRREEEAARQAEIDAIEAKKKLEQDMKDKIDVEMKRIIVSPRGDFKEICKSSRMPDQSMFRIKKRYQEQYNPDDEIAGEGFDKVMAAVPDLGLPYKNSVNSISQGMRNHFRFPSKEVADIYISAWLMKGGSIVLKGVPGTGKTTLIEASTLCFCYPFSPYPEKLVEELKKLDAEDLKIEHVYKEVDKRFDLMTDGYTKKDETFVPGLGLIGIAKHNPDKMPEDILYYANIEMVEKTPAEEKVKTNEPEAMPFESWPGKISKRTKYDFHAQVRRIVSAPIKFQNECFPPDTYILTELSGKCIKDIKTGDVVRTYNGLGTVTDTFVKDFSGELTQIKSSYNLPITLTDNHPVWVAVLDRCIDKNIVCKKNRKDRCEKCYKYHKPIKHIWKDSKDVAVGDYLIIPKEKYDTIEINKIDLLPYMPSNWCVFTDGNEKEWLKYRKNLVPRYLELDKDLLKILGCYVAEGTVGKYGINMAVCKQKDRNRVMRLMRHVHEKHGLRIGSLPHFIIMGRPFANFIRATFGSGAPNKKIPDWIKTLPISLMVAFLEGYMKGDGCLYVGETDRTRQWIATTTSKQLCFDLRDIFMRLGVLPRMRKTIDNRKASYLDVYNVSVGGNMLEKLKGTKIRTDNKYGHNNIGETENFYYVKVYGVQKQKYNGKVYNFETENHTYLAPMVVHNCNRMSKAVQDAMLGLMAENKVEYMGKIRESPKNCITLLDYNPHLDRPESGGQELDIAFLDRIDVGIYLTKPSVYDARELLKATTAKGRSIKQRVGMDIAKQTIDPLSYDELIDVWDLVSLIRIPDRAMEKAVIYCSILSNSFMRYAAKQYAPLAGVMVPGTTDYKFVDTSTLVYGNEALTKMDRSTVKGVDNHQTILNAIQRPLGFRGTSSLVRLARAYVYLQACSKTDVQLKDLEVTDDVLLKLLPYIADHRINLGVDRDVSQNYMNFFDVLVYNIIPKYIATYDKLWDKWLDGTDIATRRLLAMENPTVEQGFNIFLEEVAKTANITTAQVKENLKSEPTYQSIYDILVQKVYGARNK